MAWSIVSILAVAALVGAGICLYLRHAKSERADAIALWAQISGYTMNQLANPHGEGLLLKSISKISVPVGVGAGCAANSGSGVLSGFPRLTTGRPTRHLPARAAMLQCFLPRSPALFVGRSLP